jgi:hypothetical protein
MDHVAVKRQADCALFEQRSGRCVHEGLVVVSKDGNALTIDEDGAVVFDEPVGPFEGGMGAACRDGRWGYSTGSASG